MARYWLRIRPGPSDRERLGRVNRLELDRCDSEKTNDGRLIGVLLDPGIKRGPRDAPDESFPENRNRIRIEVGAAVHSPRAGENQRAAIGCVGGRGAHVARGPLHQHEIRSGLVQAAVEPTSPLCGEKPVIQPPHLIVPEG
jgi:hypothetical protein